LSVLMLAVTVGLGSLLMQQSRTLEGNVALTQEAVDANVRTLGQVQREVLRLQVLLTAVPLDTPAIDLQESFVDQRVQEGALPYQGETLGSAALLHRASDLSAEWSTAIRPQLDAAVAGNETDRIQQAGGQLTAFEKRYNQLVSDGEINRKVLAGQANDATRQMLAQARTLLVGLMVTAASFLVFMIVAGLAFSRSRRQRESVAAELTALNAELRTHATVVHATDNLVIVTDRSGRIEWVNGAFERATEYSLDAVKGRRPGDVLQGPETASETIEIMGSAMREGRSFAAEVLNYSASGRKYWVNIEAHPVFDNAGKVTRFVAIETDVTDRRQTEENLRSATETALSLAQEKTAFLATMSHEIRTPLNAVLGITELLAGTDLNAEQQQYVSTARRSGTLLLALVNDILDFSALESGRIEVEKRTFSVSALLADIRSMFATVAANAALTLVVAIDDTVPDFVCSDENRIRQVLVNLVANALKFTHQGGVRIHIAMATGADGTPNLSFAVQDTGIGIDADRQQRVFQPFTQVDASTTREYGGTGLGLSICRLIAQHLCGALELRSSRGDGSTFTFTVPVERAVQHWIPAQPMEPGRPSGPTTSTLRVLVAEDDATNRMVALRMLSRLGVTADWAADGVDAVVAVRDHDYDLVLMDVHMPRLDGLGATAQIHAMSDTITPPSIVALTANALAGDIERLLDAGMDGYLSKPITLGALSELLQAIDAGDGLPHARR
jgi:PAS domain S-box-containing protein